MKTIGKNIAKRRKELGMTQEDLCGLVPMDRSYLSDIENAKYTPRIIMFIKIAKALNSSLDDLVK